MDDHYEYVRKNRIFICDSKSGRALCQVVYNKSGFVVKSNTNFMGAEYHEGWANKYAKNVSTIKEVETIISNIIDIRVKAQAERDAKKVKTAKSKTNTKTATKKATEAKSNKSGLKTTKKTTKKTTLEDMLVKADKILK